MGFQTPVEELKKVDFTKIKLKESTVTRGDQRTSGDVFLARPKAETTSGKRICGTVKETVAHVRIL